ncbi:jasmonate-induced protein homolog [Chenopodium quinoa]|uniref:jasmonate-induced protein homolog n=1 Tax=Chenopodium quinoa TaxID=63459 RepID=UPI000B779934|nr:jasmonate-induced protein homolog [Chenopodium quinoa]
MANRQIEVEYVTNKKDGMQKAEQKVIEKPIRNSCQGHKAALVGMSNETKDVGLMFLQYNDWCGSVVPFYPTGISPKSSDSFGHLPDPAYGSKGAVVYYGQINQTTEGAWLLAWSAPVVTGGSVPPNNQVYVETGNKKDFENIDWKVIQEKLDKSGKVSNCTDQTTGCTAVAEINPNDDSALILATFM